MSDIEALVQQYSEQANHCNPFLRTCLQGYQQTSPTSRGGGVDFFLNAVNRTLYCVKIEDALKF